MGSVVVMSDGFCVAAAYSDDTGAMDSGVVKVFNQATGALMFTIPNPTPAPSENFGRALAISGTRLVVGCPFDGTGASSAGSSGKALSTGTGALASGSREAERSAAGCWAISSAGSSKSKSASV